MSNTTTQISPPTTPTPFPYTTLFRSACRRRGRSAPTARTRACCCSRCTTTSATCSRAAARSEEHTSELQSQSNLVCRLLLEKKKNGNYFLRVFQKQCVHRGVDVYRDS